MKSLDLHWPRYTPVTQNKVNEKGSECILWQFFSMTVANFHGYQGFISINFSMIMGPFVMSYIIKCSCFFRIRISFSIVPVVQWSFVNWPIKKGMVGTPGRKLAWVKTRANTGHAVLQSTPKPPKIRCNGPTDRPTDWPTNWWTDGRTDPLIEVLWST